MDWSSAMNDLANSWKVGLALVILVVLRFALTSSFALFAGIRRALFGRLAVWFGEAEPAWGAVPAAGAAVPVADADAHLPCPAEGPAYFDIAERCEDFRPGAVGEPAAPEPESPFGASLFEPVADSSFGAVSRPSPSFGPGAESSFGPGAESSFGPGAESSFGPGAESSFGPVSRPCPPGEQLRRSVLEFVDSGLIALVLVFMVIRPFVVQAFYIPSGSMRPTLLENDKILVSKFTFRLREPGRGDVVVFKAPPQADPVEKDFIKRLVGLPGDVIEVQDGIVYINGQAQNEAYIAEPPAYTMPPVLVEPGRVFVMGDNRNDSNDSHAWGQLDGSRIRGKAMLIFWPPTRMGLIR